MNAAKEAQIAEERERARSAANADARAERAALERASSERAAAEKAAEVTDRSCRSMFEKVRARDSACLDVIDDRPQLPLHV
jgi:hypothetical protein